jgi:hypothetical protein
VRKGLPVVSTEIRAGPEQFLWASNDTLIYAKNVIDDGVFTYSKGMIPPCVTTSRILMPYMHPDVHKGIYSIFAKNLTSGVTTTLVPAFPGGASRPELSRDGRTLAFVRRVRDKEALVLMYACLMLERGRVLVLTLVQGPAHWDIAPCLARPDL